MREVKYLIFMMLLRGKTWVINADKSNIGLSGSPTIVAKSFNPPPRKGGERVEGATPEEKVKKLLSRMKEMKVI